MKIFIIAYTWQDVEMNIETFHSEHKTVKRIGEMITQEGFRKPNVDENPEDYLSEWYSWVREEQDNMCDWTIILKIEEL